MSDLVVLGADLHRTAAALATAGTQLLAIADARRDLASLVDSSPSTEVRDAVARFLERWELVVWDTGDELQDLARDVRQTADGFQQVDRSLRGHPVFETPKVLADR